MDNTDLVNAVRADCGKVTNTTELTDTDITREGGYVLGRISDRIPVKKLRSFTSVKDQRAYSAETTTLRVQIVFPYSVVNDCQSLWGGNLGIPCVSGLMSANEYYNFPSLKMIDNMRIIKGLKKIRFEYNPVEKKINIDPAPDATGDVYYYFSIEKSDWTMAKLPSDFEELLVIGTTWKCLDIIMLKRVQLGGVPRMGGGVEYPADRLKPYVTEKRDEFEDKLNIKAKLYMR